MLVSTIEEYEKAVAFINEGDDAVTWDLEADGKDWRKNRLCAVGLGVCRDGVDHVWYMPFRHREGPNLPDLLIKDLWTRVLHPRRLQRLFHGSFDLKMAAFQDGYTLPDDGFFEDGILSALLLNENEPTFKLEALVMRYIDKSAGRHDDELSSYLHDRFGGSRKSVKGHLWKAPSGVVAAYGEQDVINTRKLIELHLRHLPRHRLLDLFREMCNFQVDICRMEMRGVQLNRDRLPVLYLQAEEKAAALLVELRTAAGYPINMNSHKQVQAFLGVASSAKEHLVRMEGNINAENTLEYRQWSRAVANYYRPYTKVMDDLGIMRGNIHLTTPGTLSGIGGDKRNGTVAGRLSATDPNLQQIPRGSESYRVKELFVARAGYLLFEFDYSQAEIRVAAHYSEDATLLRLLRAGQDMHDVVSKGLKIPRIDAKAINFSAWYGIGPPTFAKKNFMPLARAQRYLSGYHRMFRGIKQLSHSTTHRARTKSILKLYTGRTRHFNCPEAKPHNSANNLIQGTVAEMVRIAIMRTRREVQEALQVLTVHDSIWFELPIGREDELIPRIRRIMQEQNPVHFSLPMIVDVKGGTGFASAVDYPRGTEGIPAVVLEQLTDHDKVFGITA